MLGGPSRLNLWMRALLAVLFLGAVLWKVAGPRAALIPSNLIPSSLIPGNLIPGSSAPGDSESAAVRVSGVCPGCSILFVSIDGLRADTLGLYGNTHHISPAIDQFGRGAIVFDDAYTVSPASAPAHMSMFSGRYPSEHGLCSPSGQDGRSAECGAEVRRTVATLPEVLLSRGFRTVGLHGGGELSGALGFEKGFETYSKVSTQVFNRAANFLQSQTDSRDRFFLFVHSNRLRDLGSTQDPTEIQTLYHDLIRTLDKELHSLLEAALRFPRPLLVILTSDHGMEFGEHGAFLNRQLYRETTHVPLILSLPKATAAGPGRIAYPVSLISLPGTILDILGLAHEQFRGPSLFESLRLGQEQLLFQEFLPGGQVAITRGSKRLILSRVQSLRAPLWDWPHAEEFDHAIDPRERNPYTPTLEMQQALRVFLETDLGIHVIPETVS